MGDHAPEAPTAPGTGDHQGEPAPQAAEPRTPESTGSGPPENIPYARFKEVNDRLSEYKPIEEYGYDADSLHKLVEFDSAFSTDPTGTWLDVGMQLDLPDAVKAAIQATKENTEPVAPPGQQPPPQDEQQEEEKPPAWAQELLDWKRDQDKYAEEEEEAEAKATFDGMVQEIMDWWDEEDKNAGLPEVPEKQKLNRIVAEAQTGGHASVEALREAARGDVLALREVYLTPVARRSDAPKPVPGGGGTPPNELPPPKTLTEATARARADLEAGRR